MRARSGRDQCRKNKGSLGRWLTDVIDVVDGGKVECSGARWGGVHAAAQL